MREGKTIEGNAPNQESEKQRHLQQLEGAFLNIQKGISDELERSPDNNWINCFNTQTNNVWASIAVIEKDLQNEPEEELKARMKKGNQQLEILRERLDIFRGAVYTKPDDVIPKWVQNKLLNFLTPENIFEENEKKHGQKENCEEKLKDKILDALVDIKKESDHQMGDVWFESFKSNVSSIIKYLNSVKGELDTGEYNRLQKELKKLPKKCPELMDKIIRESADFEEIKRELLKSLIDVL